MAWNYYRMDWVVVLRCETFVLEEGGICLKGIGHLSWGCQTIISTGCKTFDLGFSDIYLLRVGLLFSSCRTFV